MEFTGEYFFGVALIVAASVNIVLAGMLLFDSNNYLYDETPRYLRSRRLTGMALAVFGLGFLLHWLFMPHFNNLLVSKALSFTYFHIGGVLFSMSHTSLIDRHYLNRRVVVRNASVLIISLAIYWINVFIGNMALTYVGSALFFLHIGYLTWVFYSHFHRIYKQLGSYADFRPNNTDHEVLWLHYSCHLIIAFGIGGMLCTVVFHDSTLPFTILLIASVGVFSYIYKALDSFGFIASEADANILDSEEYEMPYTGSDSTANEILPDDVKERIEQWISERHYTNPTLTVRDVLDQVGITDGTLAYYIESQVGVSGYRQWLTQLRIEEAKRMMLEHPNYSLQTIAQECGYSNNSSLSRAFRSHEGIPPVEWLNKNRKQNNNTQS